MSKQRESQAKVTARQPGRRQPLIPWSYLFFGGVLVGALVALATLNNGTHALQRPTGSKLKLQDIPISGERAYAYLKEICAIGPRVSASEGMQRQQAYLKSHFEKLGGKVTLQEFPARHPQMNGKTVQLANPIIECHPDRKSRFLFSLH